MKKEINPTTISRRTFTIGLPLTLLSGCNSFISGELLWGAFKCTAELPRGTQVYPVKIRRFERLDLEEQQGRELCWAAAIQSVYKYVGINVSQERIISKIRDGGESSRYSSANLREILNGVGGNYSSWHITNGNSSRLVADLVNGSVVILGLKSDRYATGHIVVAYGATYVTNYSTNITYIDRLWVWDPNVGKGFRVLSGCKVEQELDFSLHPRVLGRV